MAENPIDQRTHLTQGRGGVRYSTPYKETLGEAACPRWIILRNTFYIPEEANHCVWRGGKKLHRWLDHRTDRLMDGFILTQSGSA